uniref:hypothetical protein n=1 Tax=Pseudomonas sp. TaxID=306 RepID=UPI002354785C
MRNDFNSDATREAWIVTIAVECEGAGLAGAWHVEATCAGPESRKSIELHDRKKCTSQDDLQLRAAIAAVVEIRLVS